MVPNRLDLPWQKRLVACRPQDRRVGGRSVPDLGRSIVAALDHQGFSISLTSPLQVLARGFVPGFHPPATVLLAERNLKLDQTRSRALRRRSIAMGVVVLALIGALVAVFTLNLSIPGLLVPVLAIAIGFLGGIVMISFASVDFWSEFLFVAYGATLPSSPGAEQKGDAIGEYTVRAWTGVTRSENWASKTGSGRSPKQVYPTGSLDAMLSEFLDEVAAEPSSAVLR
jgi:hypothetical protein